MNHRRAIALLLACWTLGPLLGGRAFAQQETPTETPTHAASAPGDAAGSDGDASETTDAATSEATVTETEIAEPEITGEPPADADVYQLPADLDDYALPDDLDDAAVDDEWNFDAVDEDNTPLVLPLFGETTFTLTSTTQGQYRFDNFNANQFDDDFLSFWEKLEVALQGEELRVGARLDAFVPLLTSDCPEAVATNCFYEHDVRLERFSVHYERNGFTADVVDSYAVLGRGIALSLRRVDLLGVDTTLRGGQVAYDEGRVFARVLGGSINPQNLDPQTLRIIREPKDQLRRDLFSNPERRDFIVGGEAGYRLAGIELGVHGHRTYFGEQGASHARQVDVMGWRLDAPSLAGGKLALYGEINGLRRHTEPVFGQPTVDSGHAFYATAQLQLERLAMLLEWKDYSNFRVAQENGEPGAHRIYGASPTLEREQERPEALHNARGGRLQLDYGFLPGPWSLSVTALAYGFAENSDVDPFDGILVTHGFAKVQRVPQGGERIGWSFALEAGYRRETYLELDELFADVIENREFATIYHGLVEAGIVIGDHSLELLVRHRQERHHEAFGYQEFVRGEAALTYSYAGRFRVSPTFLWNDQQASTPTFYGGLEARYDFLGGSFIRVFGGQTPGGLLCSGGVCRDVPPFQGATAELVLRL